MQNFAEINKNTRATPEFYNVVCINTKNGHKELIALAINHTDACIIKNKMNVGVRCPYEFITIEAA